MAWQYNGWGEEAEIFSRGLPTPSDGFSAVQPTADAPGPMGDDASHTLQTPASPTEQSPGTELGPGACAGPADTGGEASGGMKRYFIQTYGCQMNFYDSELVGTILRQCGYAPAGDMTEADLVLLNTCAVRDHAEQRVFGRIGELKALKDDRPGLIMGVLGCMSQRIGQRILERSRHVDLVAGPDSYRRIPEMLARIESGEGPQQALTLDGAEDYGTVADTRGPGGLKAWLAVQRGCNFGCTYCIVPYVRGRERYRSIKDVLGELERLVHTGTRDVTLLGQTINAYRDDGRRFDALLRACNEVEGLWRVRYTTSHPLKMQTDIFRAMAECEKVCEFLHLPCQAGSDRVLKHMRRGYTAGQYKAMIEEARRLVPGLAVATDIIVGYPTETEEEFQETLRLIEDVQPDMVYHFKFSTRPGTPAEEFEDDVPEPEKQDRLERLIRLSREVGQRGNDRYIGSAQEVLVDGVAERNPERRLVGRTRNNKPVHFDGPESLLGTMVEVAITEAGPHSLLGGAR